MRRFQFSLKAMFALTFLVAIICALWLLCLNVAYPARLFVFGVMAYLVFILGNVFWCLFRVYSGIMKEIREVRAQGREPTPMEGKEIYERVSWSVMETTPLVGQKWRKWKSKREQAEGAD